MRSNSGLGKDFVYFTDNSIGAPEWASPSSAVRRGRMVFYRER